VAREHARVRVVEDRGLDPAAEEGLRPAHEVLVEGVLARDHDREPVAAPARAAPLLAQARDGSGETDGDHAVEQPDVDPQLERVGRGHAEQVALDEPPLDLAPLRGRVAGAVGRQSPCERGIDAVRREPVDQLRGLTALRKAERPEAALDEVGEEPRRLAERARAEAEVLVEEGWVPERDRPFRARRAVVADRVRVEAGEGARELRRVRDRRRGEKELRRGAVDAGQPPEAPDDVPDVRAEDAAVDVRLVDDDVAEVRQHVAPAVVVGEHANVEHVRVRQDDVRPLADLPALVGRRVAVVDGGPDARRAELREAARLVLRERLRRIEVERAELRLARERVEHRQVERERLAGRSAGRDDDVLAAPRCLPRGGLVRVEARDAGVRERFADARVDLVGNCHGARLAGRLLADVRELLAVEQRLPAGPCDAHRRARRATMYG
jgi:hypothetical protein